MANSVVVSNIDRRSTKVAIKRCHHGCDKNVMQHCILVANKFVVHCHTATSYKSYLDTSKIDAYLSSIYRGGFLTVETNRSKVHWNRTKSITINSVNIPLFIVIDFKSKAKVKAIGSCHDIHLQFNFSLEFSNFITNLRLYVHFQKRLQRNNQLLCRTFKPPYQRSLLEIVCHLSHSLYIGFWKFCIWKYTAQVIISMWYTF